MAYISQNNRGEKCDYVHRRTHGFTEQYVNLHIKYSQLGRGYGKMLWDYVNDTGIKNGISKLSIVCGKNVTAFYTRMGIEKIGEIDSKVNPGVKIDLLQYHVKN